MVYELFFYVKFFCFNYFCVVKSKDCIFTTEIRNAIKKDFLMSISIVFQQHLYKKSTPIRVPDFFMVLSAELQMPGSGHCSLL